MRAVPHPLWWWLVCKGEMIAEGLESGERERDRARERESINGFSGVDLFTPLQQKLQLACQDEMHVG